MQAIPLIADPGPLRAGKDAVEPCNNRLAKIAVPMFKTAMSRQAGR